MKRLLGRAGLRPAGGPPPSRGPLSFAGLRITRTMLAAIGGVLLLVAALAAAWRWHGQRDTVATAAAPATYVGRQACATCHAEADRRWQSSHHAQAMLPATPASVAGDFGDARFTYAGVTSVFSRRDGKFIVRTDGPDGALRDYEITHTFGVWPLQQYLVPLSEGRVQALSIAWDARPRSEGGHRWFHLYPGESVTHRDPLHWTGPAQNWNHMCSECHSTGVRKNYDAAARRFATTWAEVNVACEACHGPGSRHVAWARKEAGWRQLDGGGKGLAVVLDDRRGVAWAMDQATGSARRTPAGRPTREVEACGRCHSRRAQLGDGGGQGRPLGDTHRVALLDEGLYHADGQIRDEVYEHGSFLQSKMFARGVTCSDCHDPHGGGLRAPGSQVCSTCHADARYRAPSHHFHAAGSRGADCVGCHMPATTYMVVDPRHDHSLRVPRPDLSVALGVPNACARCHADRSAEWAAQRVQDWYGRPARGLQAYAPAFASASKGAPGAAEQLRAIASDPIQPPIARASAIERLGPAGATALPDLVRDAVRDADALVRRATARALDGAPATPRVQLLLPLLGDPVRDVRLEAARVLAGVPRDMLSDATAAALDRVLAEYVATQEFNADRPESHVNLALLHLARGRAADAESALRLALEADPSFSPAAVNLADLYRAGGRDAEGERVLRAALARDPRGAATRHALGLLLVRQKRLDEALRELEAAARLAPDNARFGYVYAVGLHGAARTGPARDALTRVLARHPYDRDTLAAATAYALDQGDTEKALELARRLAEVDPTNPQARALVERLDRGSRR